jgi:p-hydroxybenzoate 3-monooxygenase
VRTQVGIIGAGPAGLTLGLLLQREGIECVILENRGRDYVERRARAGLLEQNTVDLMRALGVADRLGREALEHDGIKLRHHGETIDIAITELTGRHVTIYGQHEVLKDLIASALERELPLNFEVADTAVHEIDSARPRVTYTDASGSPQQLECDFIAGCDGFHGISRDAIPPGILSVYEIEYPFGWLGILAHAAPATDELIYAWHDRGFALYTMRSKKVSLLYIQVPVEERLEEWPDDRVWEELQLRLATEGWRVNEGEVFDKAITPMRSAVCEPMQYGRLLIAGDAAHIVPPTGAKGLNLAVNDARLMAAAIEAFYRTGSDEPVQRYSERALRRVWRAQDFSNYMTQLLHDLGHGPFDSKLQLARLEYLKRSEAAARSLAENYAGLPAEPDF